MAGAGTGFIRPRMIRFLSAGASGLALAVAGGSAVAGPREEIVVTATPIERTLSEIAAPVTVLDRADILDRGGGQLGEALGNEPGIAQSSFARGASRPIIRGLDNFRVRVQENGIGAHDASALSEDHGVPIDPLAARRIEVIRGPAALRYGSEAIGGLVSVLNDRVPSRMPESGLAGEAFGAVSSGDRGMEGGVLLDGRAGAGAFHFDAYGHRTRDYRIPRDPGRQDLTRADSWGTAAGASLIRAWGHAGLALSRYESRYGIPGSDEDIEIDMEQTRATVDAKVALEGAFESAALTGGYTWYTHDEVDLETGDIGSTFDNEEGEARLEIVHAPLGPLRGAFGLQGRHRDLSAGGEGGELLAPGTTDALAAFLFEEWPLTERLRLDFGARVETVRVEGTGLGFVAPNAGIERDFARDFTAVSGSAGAVLALGAGIVLGATAQYVERAPDALELSAKGPHEATETFEIGNPDLGKESALSGEISLKRAEGALTFEITAYRTEYRDFIFKSLTGLVCDDDLASCGAGSELDQVVYGQRDAHFTGIEGEADWRFAKLGERTFALHVMGDMLEAKFDGGGHVPRIPPRRYGIGLFSEGGALEGRIDLVRVARQGETAALETPTKGFLRLDTAATYSIPGARGRPAIAVGVQASNLLDEDMRNHVSFKKADVLQPGRSMRLFLRAQF